MYSPRNILDMLNDGYETKSYTVVDIEDFVVCLTDDPNEAYGVADEEAGDRVYEEITTLSIIDDTLNIDVELVELKGLASDFFSIAGSLDDQPTDFDRFLNNLLGSAGAGIK